MPPADDDTQLLQSLYSNNKEGQPLICDVRPPALFQQRRLAGSVSIPLLGFTSRCYLLPDKGVAFSVVLPPPGVYTVVTDQAQQGSLLPDGSTAVWLKGTPSLPEFLSSRGWAHVSACLHDTPALWSAAAALSVLEQGPPADPQQLARRCLFAPSNLLAANINRVEAALTQACQQQQQQRVCFRALDVGCGSGRDVAWLASRQVATAAAAAPPHPLQQQASNRAAQQPQPLMHQRQQQQQQQQQQVHWHVTGVDEWLGALERAAEVAEAMSLGPDKVRLAYAQICPETGAIQQLQVPSKSKLSKCALAMHSGSSGPGGVDPLGRFDLILCCRFLVRALLPKLPGMLNPGGFLLYCTFVDLPGVRAFGRPAGPEHLLQPGELSGHHFGRTQGFQVLEDSVVTTADGREVCWFVARKC
jgi:SAM-dependent methyltransferase